MAATRHSATRPVNFISQAVLLCLVLASSSLQASNAIASPDDILGIQVSGDTARQFRVHLAQSPQQRAQGLMYVRTMPKDVGMLFVYDHPTVINMWMKNTYIPLDMIFIGKDGRILKIARNAVPLSLDTISSDDPAIGVLEINGGVSDSLGLAPGQKVSHRLLPDAAGQ